MSENLPKRRALLIGNSNFADYEEFTKLSTPANDVNDFAQTLKKYGEFEIIELLIDEKIESISCAIEDFYREAEKGAVTLLYYSGHGYIDNQRNLYLVARDTMSNRPLSTGLSEQFIYSAMLSSRSQHKIVVLDCCYSGKFAEGGKSGSKSVLFEKLQGQTTAILASSNAVQKSFEEKDGNSLFTKHLIEGVHSGKADTDKDGLIDVVEFFEYAEEKVKNERPEQTPAMSYSQWASKVIVAKNPKISSIRPLSEIDAEILHNAGIMTGKQRLELIEVCYKVKKKLVHYRNSLEKTLDQKKEELSKNESEFFRSMHQVSSNRNNQTYIQPNYKDSLSSIPPPISRDHQSSGTDTLAAGLGLAYYLWKANDAEKSYWKKTNELVQQIKPLIEPVRKIAKQAGANKSELYLKLDKDLDILLIETTNFNNDEQTFKILHSSIRQAENSLSKFIGSLNGWKIADPIDYSADWFFRKIKHLFEIEEIQPKIQNKIPLLLDSLSNIITNAIVEQAALPTLYAWQDGRIATLSNAMNRSDELFKEWAETDAATVQVISYLNEWHNSLKSEIDKVLLPLYREFNIPSEIPALPSSLFEINKVDFADGMNPNQYTPGQKGVQFAANSFSSLIKGIFFLSGTGVAMAGGIIFIESTFAIFLAGLVGLLIMTGGEKISKEKVGERINKKYLAANIPLWIRKKISKEKIRKKLYKEKPKIKETVQEELFENWNSTSLIELYRQEIETQAKTAAKEIQQKQD